MKINLKAKYIKKLTKSIVVITIFSIFFLFPLFVVSYISNYEYNGGYGEIERINKSWGSYTVIKRSYIAEPFNSRNDYYSIEIKNNISSIETLNNYFNYRKSQIEIFIQNFEESSKGPYLSSDFYFNTLLPVDEFKSFFKTYLYKYGSITLVKSSNETSIDYYFGSITTNWELELGEIQIPDDNKTIQGILSFNGYLKLEEYTNLFSNYDLYGLEALYTDITLNLLVAKYSEYAIPVDTNWGGFSILELVKMYRFNP